VTDNTSPVSIENDLKTSEKGIATNKLDTDAENIIIGGIQIVHGSQSPI
jgi:hypothetical protein